MASKIKDIVTITDLINLCEKNKVKRIIIHAHTFAESFPVSSHNKIISAYESYKIGHWFYKPERYKEKLIPVMEVFMEV